MSILIVFDYYCLYILQIWNIKPEITIIQTKINDRNQITDVFHGINFLNKIT